MQSDIDIIQSWLAGLEDIGHPDIPEKVKDAIQFLINDYRSLEDQLMEAYDE